MRKPVTLLLVGSLVLASCGWRDSRLNPGNWFGRSRSVAVEPAEAKATNPLLPKQTKGMFSRPEPEDLSVPITTVTTLRADVTPTGAIIYAEGVAQRTGAHKVELRDITTPEDKADRKMVLSFRVVYPEDATIEGTEFSRTIHAAHSVTKDDLADLRLIRVEGERNAQEIRRR